MDGSATTEIECNFGKGGLEVLKRSQCEVSQSRRQSGNEISRFLASGLRLWRLVCGSGKTRRIEKASEEAHRG